MSVQLQHLLCPLVKTQCMLVRSGLVFPRVRLGSGPTFRPSVNPSVVLYRLTDFSPGPKSFVLTLRLVFTSVQHDMNAALLSNTYTPYYCGRHGNSPVCWVRGRETEAANQNAADSPYPPAENEWKLTSTVYQWSSSNPSTADAGWTGTLPAQCVLWSRGFWEEEALTRQSYPAGTDVTPAISRKGTLALLTPHHTWGR